MAKIANIFLLAMLFTLVLAKTKKNALATHWPAGKGSFSPRLLAHGERFDEEKLTNGNWRYTYGTLPTGPSAIAFSDSVRVIYPVLSDVDLPIKYYGKNIKYISITVEQTSNMGEAYLYAGGIDKSFVEFHLISLSTNFLNYELLIITDQVD